MAVLVWDKPGERLFETGVDHGVLYPLDAVGLYPVGYAWNGLTTVTESPTGGETSAQYADNIKYLNLLSVEEFGGTIEAFTYPEKWAECDGSAEPLPGITIGQQQRKTFGLAYRTRLGNDQEGADFAYKLHLVWGALAAPSEKAFATINDSPEAITFSWAFTTTPVPMTSPRKPTASMVIDSTKVNAAALANLETTLYGTASADPRLPMPEEVIAMFAGTITMVTPVAPTYDSATDTITIPTVTGVVYSIDGEVVTGAVVITQDTLVTAKPAPGYAFTQPSDDDWFFDFV